MKVIIIGGVAGGASAAARLRRLDEKCEIILFERGEYISYANCGLPYYIGEVITEKEKLVVQTPAGLKQRFNIDVRTNNEVVRIDAEKKEVEIHDLKTNTYYFETYDKLILSPGATPVKPNLPGFDGNNVFTMRTIPDTYAIKDFIDIHKPKRVVVVGGGFIGLELAENLAQKGLKVSLVQSPNQVLRPIDFEMAALVHQHLKEKGLELYLENSVTSIRKADNYSIVSLKDNTDINADMIIVGIGVTPDVTLAKTAYLTLGERGGIKVDKKLQTSNPDIYAIGDAIEVIDYINDRPTLIALAGPANKQGRIAANNICGIPDEYTGTQGTSVLKVFDLTVAFTGNNENLLKNFTIPYEKSYTHSLSHAGYYPGATFISLKLLFSPTDGKILGAQAVGYTGVEKRIDVLATAIRAGMTVHDLEKLELAYAPPYSSAKDPVNMAGYVASNIVKKDCLVFHWDELSGLDPAQSLLIDVRTPAEFKLGTITGAINIPLDELRNRLSEIPTDKEVLLFCQVGLRGYLAYRILIQHGYQSIKNLSGGYKTYSTASKEQSNRGIFDYDTLAAVTVPQATTAEVNELHADVSLNACSLQCPGPIIQVNDAMKAMAVGTILKVTATDPAFGTDVTAWCESTGHQLLGIDKSPQLITAYIKKSPSDLAAGKKKI